MCVIRVRGVTHVAKEIAFFFIELFLVHLILTLSHTHTHIHTLSISFAHFSTRFVVVVVVVVAASTRHCFSRSIYIFLSFFIYMLAICVCVFFVRYLSLCLLVCRSSCCRIFNLNARNLCIFFFFIIIMIIILIIQRSQLTSERFKTSLALSAFFVLISKSI